MSFWDDLAGNGDSATQQYLQDALKKYQTLQTPTIQSEQVNNIPQETVQGTVTPEQIESVDQAPSAYNNVVLDPQSRQAVVNALTGYQSIADDGGLDANAKLGIQQAEDAATTQSRGEQGAIQNAAQAMGQGGGDFALVQRALSGQGASNTAATQGMQQAAEAEANREAALSALGTLGTNLNSSDFNQASTKAAAQNTINATNAGYQNAAKVGNVANNAAAQQYNVGNAQTVNANNTAANQNNAYYNASLPQQQFENELQKASGAAGVNTNQASAAQNSANGITGAIGKGVGAAGTVAANYYGGGAGSMGTSNSAKPVAGNTSSSYYQMNSAANAPAGATTFAKGGTVCYAQGGMAVPHNHSICMEMGGHVAGDAQVPGNSEQNDTVPAMLSPGELVIPRSVPKNGPAMEAFAQNAPVNGDAKKRVDLTAFTKGYKRSR